MNIVLRPKRRKKEENEQVNANLKKFSKWIAKAEKFTNVDDVSPFLISWRSGAEVTYKGTDPHVKRARDGNIINFH